MGLSDAISVELTPLGMPYLVICAVILVLRPAWLVPFLIVAAVLHAPAVAILHVGDSPSAIGLSPWLLASTAVIVHLAWRLVVDKGLGFQGDPQIRVLLIGWSILVALAVLGAFVLPHVFEGTMVYSLANRHGVDAPTTPLGWSLVNGVQAFNLGVYWLLLLYMAKASQQGGFVRRAGAGFAIAIAASVGLSLYQRGVHVHLLPNLDWFADSLNPSYVQVTGGGLSIRRLPWPFSESSYASVWFAAVYGGGLSVLLLTRRWLLGGLCVAAGIVGMLNALGTAGLASAGMISVILALMAVKKHRDTISRDGSMHHALPWKQLVLSIAIVLVAALLALELSGLGSPLAIWQKLILPRLLGEGASGLHRATSNWHALELVVQTYGLGTGLGSNRASSYALSMLSNLGVILTLEFVGLIGYQVWLLLVRTQHAALSLFLVFGGLTSFIGICLAIPDFSWPAWWVWVLCIFAMAARARPAAKTRLHPTAVTTEPQKPST